MSKHGRDHDHHALPHITRALEEAGVRCEQGPLDSLTAIIAASRHGMTIIVGDDLGPEEQLFLYLHCFAHVHLRHLQDGFGIRMEYARNDHGVVAPQLQAQEEEADSLVRTWLRGEQLPEALLPLGMLMRNHRGPLLRTLLLLRRIGVRSSKFTEWRASANPAAKVANRLRATLVEETDRRCLFVARINDTRVRRESSIADQAKKQVVGDEERVSAVTAVVAATQGRVAENDDV